nr:MAG TPA: hypothetical protein [Caudoviricetes sp.]
MELLSKVIIGGFMNGCAYNEKVKRATKLLPTHC